MGYWHCKWEPTQFVKIKNANSPQDLDLENDNWLGFKRYLGYQNTETENID